MYTSFAHSDTMHFLLSIISNLSGFMLIYFVSEIILFTTKVYASKKQKFLFAFLHGTILSTVTVFAVYIVIGDFTKKITLFVTTPTPISAFVLYFLSIKILKVSPLRSINIIKYMYIFTLIFMLLQKIIYNTFFYQLPDDYYFNYLQEALALIVLILITFVTTKLLIYLLKKYSFSLEFTENNFFNKTSEWLSFIFTSTIAYFIVIIYPIVFKYSLFSYVQAFLLLLLFFIVIVCTNIISYDKKEIQKSAVHISALFKSNEEFRSIKHDFYNILQTYSGYIALGDMDKLKNYHERLLTTTTTIGESMELAKRMSENPALISLLIKKLEYAEKLNVKIQLYLTCNLFDLYIDNMQLCRMIACLLDNAIEASSESRLKLVHLTAESTKNNSKIIIITNSTEKDIDTEEILKSGYTSKDGHAGIGLSTVRKFFSTHGNCTFKINCFNNEFSAYLELRKDKAI